MTGRNAETLYRRQEFPKLFYKEKFEKEMESSNWAVKTSRGAVLLRIAPSDVFIALIVSPGCSFTLQARSAWHEKSVGQKLPKLFVLFFFVFCVFAVSVRNLKVFFFSLCFLLSFFCARNRVRGRREGEEPKKKARQGKVGKAASTQGAGASAP